MTSTITDRERPSVAKVVELLRASTEQDGIYLLGGDSAVTR